MFCPTYTAARNLFLNSAREALAEIYHLPIPSKGPKGEELVIDIAALGHQPFTKVLLHTSGIHGVEGFAGSAIQCLALKQKAEIPPSTALVFVHAINPFGMAWLRRVNESNVDLNRNFLSAGESFAGMDPKYGDLDSFLNPKEGLGSFWTALISNIFKHGFSAAKKAITEGQYENGRGLFFGGSKLEAGPALVKTWAKQHLTRAAAAITIDVHTGLGRFGRETLFYHGVDPAPDVGKRPTPLTVPIGYKVRGGLENLTAELFPGRAWAHFTQEFGTYSMLEALRVLRAENWEFQRTKRVGEWQKRLLETMNPDNANWRQAVLDQGMTRIKKSLEWLGGIPI